MGSGGLCQATTSPPSQPTRGLTRLRAEDAQGPPVQPPKHKTTSDIPSAAERAGGSTKGRATAKTEYHLASEGSQRLCRTAQGLALLIH